ncbi:hypothetical protein [Slackia piriformis]|uniref:Uncharacterized protein n=1 Tax=Slackia piriformis YIT 12062 TaxID=742818 RepID=K0YHZ9_9ACTN|nr:hypothetical protein [Slackia piriformis]EJZ83147.1 hypothetical protein HMPREF9451_01665 [Slackia piriformis YIT 12062]
MASPKNIGDQIFDAVQDAVSSQDFSALQSTIEYSVGLAAKNISKGLAHASRSMQQAQAEYQQEQEKRRQKQLMQAIYAKSTPSKAIGYAMAIGGGVAVVPFLLGAAIVSTSGIAAFFVPPLLFAAGGLVLCGFGIRRLRLTKSFELYRDIISTREYCTVEELAARTAASSKTVMKNLKAMLKKACSSKLRSTTTNNSSSRRTTPTGNTAPLSLKRSISATKKPSLKASMPHPDKARP